MVQIEISPTELIIHVTGADKFFALKSQLTIPMVHVVKAEVDPPCSAILERVAAARDERSRTADGGQFLSTWRVDPLGCP
jgi:hypothetical protein